MNKNISRKIDISHSFVNFADRMGLRKKYANKMLLKTEGEIKRQPQIPVLNSIKKVGIIWEPDGIEAYEYLKKYFEEQKVTVTDICVHKAKTKLKNTENTLTPNELDWMRLPQKGKTEYFTDNQYDLLLNIAVSQTTTINFITLKTQAKFKIGWSENKKNYLDLNINIGRNKDALFLAKQQIFYLRQLNQKTSK